MRLVHSNRHITCKAEQSGKAESSQGSLVAWIPNRAGKKEKKVRLTRLFFFFFLVLAEQAPGPVAGDGQDEPVVWAERDARHGERVALEGATEGPEGLRVIDADGGVLCGRGFARRRE
jgi:hypothetical protein